jgi:hypothetical protein
MTMSNYAPIRGFTVLCLITTLDTALVNTPCHQLIQNIPFYGNASDILGIGGSFGCFTAVNEADLPSGACVPAYKNNATLNDCLACNFMGVCIDCTQQPILLP